MKRKWSVAGGSSRVHRCRLECWGIPLISRDFASVGTEQTPQNRRGIHVLELPKYASSHDGRPTRLESCGRNRGAELAAQADLMLARYPADVRQQITELLQVLAKQPGEAENGVR